MHQTIHVATIPQAPLTSNMFCIWITSFMSLQQLALAWKSGNRRKGPWRGGKHRDEGLRVTPEKLTSSQLLPQSGVLSSQMKHLGHVNNFEICVFLDCVVLQIQELGN